MFAVFLFIFSHINSFHIVPVQGFPTSSAGWNESSVRKKKNLERGKKKAKEKEKKSKQPLSSQASV